jgi:peptidoglycan-associated lipoprotein
MLSPLSKGVEVMKRFFSVQGPALVFICSLLLAGCVNKVASNAPPADSETPAVATISPEQPVGVQQPDVAEAPVGDQQPAAQEEQPVAELGCIHFDFDRFTLSPKARETLAANAAVLLGLSEVRVSIEGHCDQRGSDSYNLALGERRAQAARDYLVSLGVAPDRLQVISYGEEKPLVSANTEEAWAQNRRDEFKVIP